MKNRKRNRKLGYDYSLNNLYFITICVQDKKCCFGNIHNVNKDCELSEHNTKSEYKNENLKNIVSQEMILNNFGKIAMQQWEWLTEQYSYVVLHSFIVMPNHIHGILEIDSHLAGDKEIKIKPLSQLIGAYKTTTSKLIHLAGHYDFAWQRSFHDHIIRNDYSYHRIANYIETNPERWNSDIFF